MPDFKDYACMKCGLFFSKMARFIHSENLI